jgi:hypothetical protein
MVDLRRLDASVLRWRFFCSESGADTCSTGLALSIV